MSSRSGAAGCPPFDFEALYHKLKLFDEEAEMSVVGAMLLDRDVALALLDRLSPEDFFKPSNVEVFTVLRDLYAHGDGQAVDSLTVKVELDRRSKLDGVGGYDYLVTCMEFCPITANAAQYGSIVWEQSRRRELAREAGNLLAGLGNGAAAGPASTLGDVVAGHDRNIARIKAAIEDAGRGGRAGPFADVTALELVSQEDLVVSWLWQDTIPTGAVSMIYARPKVGKSTLLQELAVRVARGAEHGFLGRPIAKGNVRYHALEDRPADVKTRLQQFGVSTEPILFNFELPARKPCAQLCADVEADIRTHDFGLYIIDTAQTFLRIERGDDYALVTNSLIPLEDVARRTGCAIVIAHHAGKAQGNGPLGSTAYAAKAASLIELRKRDDRTRTIQSMQRVGVEWPETILTLSASGRLELEGAVQELRDSGVEDRILQALRTQPDATQKDLQERTGLRKSDLSEGLARLHGQGKIASEGRGIAGEPRRYMIPSS